MAPAQAVQQAGGAVANLGEALGEAHVRIRNRESTVEAVRTLGEVRQTVEDEYRRLETESDFSKPETVEAYRAFVDDAIGRNLEGFGGNLDSRARLTERLEGLRSEAISLAASTSVQEQRRLVAFNTESGIGRIAAKAFDAPGDIEAYMQEADELLTDMAPALSEAETRVYRVAARSQITKSAVEGLIAHGAFDDAERILTQPGMAEFLGPDDMRRLRFGITSQRVAEERQRNAFADQIASVERVVGPLSREQKLHLAGLAPKVSAPTPAQNAAGMIAMAELILGRPLNENEVLSAFKLETGSGAQDNPFGAGIHGRALSIIEDLSEAFAMGITTPEEERRLESAITALKSADPSTGMRFTDPPAYLIDALEARGLDADAVLYGEASILPRAGGAPPSGTAAPRGQSPVSLDLLPGERTMWDMASDVTGVVPSIVAALHKVPGMTAFLPESDIVQSRASFRLMRNEITQAFQNNPRYAIAEWQRVMADLDIDPAVFDNPARLQSALIGLDRTLEARERDALVRLQDRGISRDYRSALRDLVALIGPLRSRLAVPPLMRTPDEAMRLPPGSSFRTPDGQLMRVPNG